MVAQRLEKILPVELRFQLPSLLVPQVLLWGNIAPGWKLTQPLLVTIEQDGDDYYIASDDRFAVYGDGRTRYEALQDYIVSLIDYYELLAARAEDDPLTQTLFEHLQLYLHPAAE